MTESTSTPSAAAPRLRRLMLLVGSVVLVDTAFYAALTPLVPRYVQQAGLGTSAAGLLVGAYPAGTLAGALPTGVLVARVGPRRALLAGVLVMSLCCLVLASTADPVLLVPARFVQGVAGACSWAAALGWLTAAAPEARRGELLGAAFGAAAAGSLLGPALGGLASVTGPALAFGSAGVVGTVLAAWTWATPAPAALAPQRVREALPALRDRRVARGLQLVALEGLAFGGLSVLAPLRLDALGASALFISATFLVGAGLESVSGPVVGRFSDRHGRLAPTRILLPAGVVVCLLAPVLAPAAALAVLVAAGALTFGALLVPGMALAADGAQGVGLHHGFAFALVNLAWAAGMTGGAVVSGALAQAFTPHVPYALLAAALGASLLALRRDRVLA